MVLYAMAECRRYTLNQRCNIYGKQIFQSIIDDLGKQSVDLKNQIQANEIDILKVKEYSEDEVLRYMRVLNAYMKILARKERGYELLGGFLNLNAGETSVIHFRDKYGNHEYFYPGFHIIDRGGTDIEVKTLSSLTAHNRDNEIFIQGLDVSYNCSSRKLAVNFVKTFNEYVRCDWTSCGGNRNIAPEYFAKCERVARQLYEFVAELNDNERYLEPVLNSVAAGLGSIYVESMSSWRPKSNEQTCSFRRFQ